MTKLADLSETLRRDAAHYRKACLFDLASECEAHADMFEAALRDVQRETPRACACAVSVPVMQADGRFYCYVCSFQTGARPACSEPETMIQQIQRETIQQDATWMQHKSGCVLGDIQSGRLTVSGHLEGYEFRPECTCGLADRLKAITP